MVSKLQAVLIADIVASSAQRALRKRLGTTLALASRRHLHRKWIKLPYSVTAGDEFQTVAVHPHLVPHIILDLRILLQPFALRIGVGIGRIADRIQPPVNRLGGEAFQFARKAMDSVKSGSHSKFDALTFFASYSEPFNETTNLIYGLNDTLVSGITIKQWKTIAAFAKSPALASTSRRLKLDTSTVSRNLKRGYYWQLTATAKAVEFLIEHTFY
jgi:hypothetical protein